MCTRLIISSKVINQWRKYSFDAEAQTRICFLVEQVLLSLITRIWYLNETYICLFFPPHYKRKTDWKKLVKKNPNYVLQSLNTCFELYHFFQSNFGLLAKIIYCFFLTFLLICNIHVENCFAVYLQKHTGIYRNRHSSKNFHKVNTLRMFPHVCFIYCLLPQRKITILISTTIGWLCLFYYFI